MNWAIIRTLWTGTLGLCLIMIFCVSCGVLASSTAQSRCQMIYADVRNDPDLAGGYSFLAGRGTAELCLYGTLADIDLAKLSEDVANYRLDVTVSSAGGPVEVWLSLAERLEGRLERLTVDSICMSSCANYLPVIAKRLVVPEHSIMVWHGAGETRDALFERTKALYLRNRVSIALLNDTARAGDMTQFAPTQNVRQIIGYAVTPAYLTNCYGFRNLGQFWHPNTHSAINAELQRRSPSSGVFLNPQNAACD